MGQKGLTSFNAIPDSNDLPRKQRDKKELALHPKPAARHIRSEENDAEIIES